jgi:hypothetical protein
MDFGQLREAFITHTGITDEVDAAELALWFNEAQLDLAWELSQIKRQQLEPGTSSFVPPDDWLCVMGSNGLYRVSPDGNIIFEGAGATEMYYRQIPENFSGIDDSETSSLHLGLHYLLPIFAAARYWDKESEGDGDESMQASKWLSYYYQGKNLAKSRLFGMNEPIDAWLIRG